MASYFVEWTCEDVIADSPREAARECLDAIMLGAGAVVFAVTSEDGETVDIDLSDDGDDPEPVEAAA